MSNITDEIVSMLEKCKIPKTKNVKCEYCGQLRDKSNMFRHYKAIDCTWTQEESDRRKKLKKLKKEKLKLEELYEVKLAALKKKFETKITKIDLEINLARHGI